MTKDSKEKKLSGRDGWLSLPTGVLDRRRQEIGVRMALGAGRGDILLMVLREAGVLMATGVLAGSVLAAVLARYAQSLLFGLSRTDARVIGGAALLLTVVAALASLWPALRAASVPPTTALRDA